MNYMTIFMSWLQSLDGRIKMFPGYSVEAQTQGFKANAATCELNTLAHQKHEPRRWLWSGTGLVRSTVVNSHTLYTRTDEPISQSSCRKQQIL